MTQGLYEILVDDQIVYVGESINIEERAEQHIKEFWNAKKITTTAIKAGMASDGLKDLNVYFNLVFHVGQGKTVMHRFVQFEGTKRQRLLKEHELVYVNRAVGHPITNKATSISWRLRATTPQDLQAEFEVLHNEFTAAKVLIHTIPAVQEETAADIEGDIAILSMCKPSPWLTQADINRMITDKQVRLKELQQ